jgi:hypothetical protein
MTLEELIEIVRERKRLGASMGTAWPSGAMECIYVAIKERDELLNLIDAAYHIVELYGLGSQLTPHQEVWRKQWLGMAGAVLSKGGE